MEKTRLLVVDDCPDNIRFISHLVSGEDREVSVAQDGEEALRLVAHQDFALVLAEMNMPTMGGVALVRLMSALKGQYTPVLMMGDANVSPELCFEVYSAGAIDIQLRPLNAHVLKSKVDSFVRLDQQRRKSLISKNSVSLTKDHYIAALSHELRNPVGAMLGFADLLYNDSLGELDSKPILEAILRNGEVLLRLVDDVLDFSKIEAEKLSLETEVFDLRNFLVQLHADLDLRAREKGLSLHVQIPERSIDIIGDAIRIRQMLVNLLGNSLKFTDEGHVQMFFEMHNTRLTTKHGRSLDLRFRIEDTGVGISPEGVEKLFKPFGQAESSVSRQYGGTGLGLVISRQLAQMMNGDLRLISSTPGKGSVFEISIQVEELVTPPLPLQS